MDKSQITNKLIALIKNNPNGFTASQQGKLLNLKSGYAVSLTNNKHKDINKLVNRALSICKNYNNYYFGGWFDSKNKNYYLDISLIIPDKQTALNLANNFKQLAIFDFKTLNTINLLK
ncbi:MAG TPA: hypothetical protein VIR31_05815 [Nitrososphaeraceae archaeon]